MKKNSIIALLVTVVFPVICYFIIKSLTAEAVQLPRHFFADTVVTKTEKGKLVTDTVWHKLPNISLTNQNGKTISWADMKGKIVVADFFFTHCPSICPLTTANMKRLETSITNGNKFGDKRPDFIQFLSFSIDPERDSVAALKGWADRFKIDSSEWWLLTGNKKEIYDLCINEMKLGLIDGKGVDTGFIHTDQFVLIDANRNIRGYYHGLDSADLAKLSKDIIFLMLEKDKTKQSAISKEVKTIIVISTFITLLVVIAAFVYSKKNAN